MGLRFRRSVKIMPGVRLNFSARGVSTTVGGRGGSINIGSRGVYANAGIPGTGISSRTRIDGGGNSRSTSRAAYRELRAQALAAEKERARQEAESEVEEFENLVQRLTSILRNRDKNVFDWNGLVNADQGYAPQEFNAPTFDEASARKKSLKKTWLRFWALALVGSIYLLAQSNSLGMIGLIVSIVMIVKSTVEWKTVFDQRRKAFDQYMEAEREKHEKDEALRKYRADLAPRLRQAQSDGNPEPLVELLSEELANEELPIPLVFEIEFADPQNVTVDLTLPEMDELPVERVSLTARGKVSKKAMTQRDRREIYGAMCCGLALRIAYEAFRVIPTVSTVEVRGHAEVNDPTTGHEKEITPLMFSVTRTRLNALDLDDVGPEAAVDGFGGTFACTARLELKDGTAKKVGA